MRHIPSHMGHLHFKCCSADSSSLRAGPRAQALIMSAKGRAFLRTREDSIRVGKRLDEKLALIPFAVSYPLEISDRVASQDASYFLASEESLVSKRQ